LRESSADLQSLNDICTWLLGCEYQPAPNAPSDQNEWSPPYEWPPPYDFEAIRRGNCADYALWIWRALNKIGIPAELMWGQCRTADEVFQTQASEGFLQGHAWVQFQREDIVYLFDCVTKNPHELVRPLADVRSYYRPWFAVDSSFRRYQYWGYACYVLGLSPTR
jgi:hypothetical protein